MKKNFTIIITLILMMSFITKNNNIKIKEEKVQTQKNISKKIPYTFIKNYFVNNNYKNKEIEILKIFDKEKFSNIFGMATLMSSNGKPTEINFEKNFVIAIINTVSYNSPTIKINSLTNKNKKLIFNYSIAENKKQTYSTHAALIIQVDKKNDASLVSLKK